MYIGGQWRDAHGEQTFPVVNPATLEVLALLPNGTPEDGLSALDAAAAAQESWATTSTRTRSNLLRSLYEAILLNAENFATLISAEMGKPLAEARAEVNYAADFVQWFAAEAQRIHGTTLRHPDGAGEIQVTKDPVGPALLITPWNFPLAMATRKIAPALAAGCTVIIKPATLTPLTTLYLCTLIDALGFPAGTVNLITSQSASALTGPIISDSRLKKLSFTGSTEVGKRLLEQASQTVLRTSMELGGNAPFIVFEDADLDNAVNGAMIAKFRNMGQACTAANRFLVHESVADEFVARFSRKISEFRIGSGLDDTTTLGPLINQEAIDSIEDLISDSLSHGAEDRSPEFALPTSGYFMTPRILDHTSTDSDIFREEIFGPVVSITRFSSEDEAIAMANDTNYGLVIYAYTESLARTQRLKARLQTGMLGINVGVVSSASAPFGGVKESGLGREGGFEGIDEYLNTKYTLIGQSN